MLRAPAADAEQFALPAVAVVTPLLALITQAPQQTVLVSCCCFQLVLGTQACALHHSLHQPVAFPVFVICFCNTLVLCIESSCCVPLPLPACSLHAARAERLSQFSHQHMGVNLAYDATIH
jgi:hypothetical protein